LITDAQWEALLMQVDRVCNRETDRVSTYAFSVVRERWGAITIRLNVRPGGGAGDPAYFNLEPPHDHSR